MNEMVESTDVKCALILGLCEHAVECECEQAGHRAR